MKKNKKSIVRREGFESYRFCRPVLFFASNTHKKLSQVFKSLHNNVPHYYSLHKNFFEILCVGRDLNPRRHKVA